MGFQKSKQFYFLIAVIIIGIVLGSFFFFKFNKKTGENQLPATANKNADLEKIKSSYEPKIRNLYNDFLKAEDKLAATKKFKQALFDFIVPAERRDFHLNLVLALNKLESDLSAHSDDAKKTEEQIQELINSLK